MPLTIPDTLLQEAGLTERDALIELACRLFDTGKLTLWSATKWAGLSRGEFEGELRRRKIAICRPQLADVADDLRSLYRLET